LNIMKTTIDLFRLNHAHEAGVIYASMLQPGLIFLGAGPAAEAAGYIKNTPEYRMFLAGALDLMQKWIIRTDAQNRLVEVTRPGTDH
jgi:hypothetical protein